MDSFKLQILIKNINKNPLDYSLEMFEELVINLPNTQIDIIWHALLQHPHPINIAKHVADLTTILMKGYR